jgi:hypothetical protein
VEPVFTPLAQSAEITLVTLMTTDVWQRLSQRITRDEETPDKLRPQWQRRLRRLLAVAPGVREEFCRLFDEFGSASDGLATDAVPHAFASGRTRIHLAARDQHIAER